MVLRCSIQKEVPTAEADEPLAAKMNNGDVPRYAKILTAVAGEVLAV